MELNGSGMEMGREEWEVETALYIWPEESRDEWWASRVLIRHAALNVSYTLLIILSLCLHPSLVSLEYQSGSEMFSSTACEIFFQNP